MQYPNALRALVAAWPGAVNISGPGRKVVLRTLDRVFHRQEGRATPR